MRVKLRVLTIFLKINDISKQIKWLDIHEKNILLPGNMLLLVIIGSFKIKNSHIYKMYKIFGYWLWKWMWILENMEYWVWMWVWVVVPSTYPISNFFRFLVTGLDLKNKLTDDQFYFLGSFTWRYGSLDGINSGALL